ncbi:hypothetical protein [Colwellia sp. RSH04]|uniref:hypothetical protein n=1 Tax=Colwellia sp. RSH04 TaxID=2305464 RepID=UPI000E5742B7|nr:hypothetical protein [Colwellia sp. RSH04]RHW75383.1 hypothetical protein D1094_13350 [Colwellia sp. RSH04]
MAQALAQPQVTTPLAQTQQVTGQKLEEQAKSEPIETDYSILYWLALIFFCGTCYEYLLAKRKYVVMEPQELATTLKQAA